MLTNEERALILAEPKLCLRPIGHWGTADDGL